MLKKILFMILVIPFALAMTACGNDGESGNGGQPGPSEPGELGKVYFEDGNATTTPWNGISFSISGSQNNRIAHASIWIIPDNVGHIIMPSYFQEVPITLIIRQSSTNLNNLRIIDFSQMYYLERIGMGNESSQPQNQVFEGGQIETVIFGNNPHLENIFNGSFNNNNISEVILRDLPSLIRIGANAFANNPLVNITLDDLPNLNNIANNAFTSSISLEIGNLTLSGLIALENGAGTIHDGAFGGFLTVAEIRSLIDQI